MKKLNLFLLLLLLITYGCNKSSKDIAAADFKSYKHNGCVNPDTLYIKSANWLPDTSFYTLTNGNLDIFVGFTRNCCKNYETANTYISNDTIYISMSNTCQVFASCICYFPFNFYYSGITTPYYYHVNIDNWIFFNGYIEP